MMLRRTRDWISTSLRRKVLLSMGLAASAASLALLVMFTFAYRNELAQERSNASLQLNLLLQSALENAMLKRDVPGLQEIVSRLGSQPGVRDVMIINPAGEVRFASRAENLHRQFPALVPPESAQARPYSEFGRGIAGGEVLRSVNPVPNRNQCLQCHGSVAERPINGVLVVDYDAAGLRQKARQTALGLALSGALVILALAAAGWLVLRRTVLQPVARLEAAAQALGQRLDTRVELSGKDELARLGHSFNRMADQLAAAMAGVRAQQRLQQDLVDGLPDGVRVFGEDGRVILINRAYCKQLGLQREEALGQPCYVSSHRRHDPCPATLVVCPLHELKQHGQQVKCTHHHVRADGRTLHVEVHAALVELDQDGQTRRYVVESIRDLAQAVQVSQEQRLSELGLLAAGIAHEIHNPLASVRLAVQSLLRGTRDGSADAQEVAEYLEVVDGEIDKCIDVTRRLLLLSRRPESRNEVVSLNAAAQDAVRLLAYDAENRGVVQHLSLDPAEPGFIGDNAEIRMVLLNLLQNAHHAMPTGGQVEVGTRFAPNGRAEITVRDQGVGIAEADLPRIFEPFFSRRADAVPGTGLGLTICKSIVEHYGGHITVESVPGQGSTFTISLPQSTLAPPQEGRDP